MNHPAQGDAELGENRPTRSVKLDEVTVNAEAGADGVLYVRRQQPLGPYPTKLTVRLDYWATTAPDRLFLAVRGPEGAWRRITYREAREKVRRIAAALIARGLSEERPLIILSGNDLEHALMGLAALYAGVAYAPISPAYSLVSSDFGKLKNISKLLTPGLVFASDGRQFDNAMAASFADDVEIVVTRNPPASRGATLFQSLCDSSESAVVDAANAKIHPDTVAKILFTSGSTGEPKGVINTQRMLCSNAEMAAAHFAFLRDEPPVLLDWSPWNHTAGGNHNFNLALYNGGTLYVDGGKPTPGGIELTVRNLRDVSPNWYFNVPRGFGVLLPYLQKDKALAKSFFRDIKLLWYAAASMPQHLWQALDEVALGACGERILILSGLGATETGPSALAAGKGMSGGGNIGLPMRGAELKLIPADDRYEVRVRGPGVTPGYWREPELSAKAFDEEGYFKLGDALKFADPSDANKGLLFDGRITENFKLATGTWVAVGPLREAFIDHFAPYVKDVVIAGLDRDEVGALIFVDLDACLSLCRRPELEGTGELVKIAAHAEVRAEFHRRLKAFAAKSTGSSNRITRAILLDEPASVDRDEITDKGSINQRAVISNRAYVVEELYAEPPRERVITIA
jgi:feruloyl-CoA synthase